MRTGTIRYTLDSEDGQNPTGVPGQFVFELTYWFQPGEKQVRYYPDGSGYPGSADEIEFDGCRVIETDLAGAIPCESCDCWEPHCPSGYDRPAEAVNNDLAKWFDVEKHREALEELVRKDLAE